MKIYKGRRGIDYIWLDERPNAQPVSVSGGRGGDGGSLPMSAKEFREARRRARYGACSVMTCGRMLDEDPWVMNFDAEQYAVCSPECAELALLMIGQPRGLVPDPDDLAMFQTAMSADPRNWPENWQIKWAWAERPRRAWLFSWLGL